MCLTGNGIKARSHAHAETWPVALCFPGPADAPHWEVRNFHTGMSSCYNGNYSRVQQSDGYYGLSTLRKPRSP